MTRLFIPMPVDDTYVGLIADTEEDLCQSCRFFNPSSQGADRCRTGGVASGTYGIKGRVAACSLYQPKEEEAGE